MTEERNEDMNSVSFASEAEEITYLRSEIIRQKNLSKELATERKALEKKKKGLEAQVRQLEYRNTQLE